MIKKRVYYLLPLILFLSFFPVVNPGSNSKKPQVKAYFSSTAPIPEKKADTNPPTLTAESVFVLDLNSNTILFEKNPHKRLRPASLTKIMTSLVALDYYKEDNILKVVNGQLSLGNTIELLRNDEILAKNLIEGLLISSGNDAAVVLAENYPGGYKAYVDKMNQKVLELGLENTHFSNVSGVESPNHYTTAYDIAMMAKDGLTRPAFERIVSQRKANFKSLKGTPYSLTSTNILLNKPGFYGVKTGWTPLAGECLVVLADKDAHPILISILNSKDRFGEAEKITNWVYQNYTWN